MLTDSKQYTYIKCILCDPMWHVSFCSGVVLVAQTAIRFLTHLLTYICIIARMRITLLSQFNVFCQKKNLALIYYIGHHNAI